VDDGQGAADAGGPELEVGGRQAVVDFGRLDRHGVPLEDHIARQQATLLQALQGRPAPPGTGVPRQASQGGEHGSTFLTAPA
jgi:hypothetical protein